MRIIENGSPPPEGYVEIDFDRASPSDRLEVMCMYMESSKDLCITSDEKRVYVAIHELKYKQ
jgi:hypothetical protein